MAYRDDYKNTLDVDFPDNVGGDITPLDLRSNLEGLADDVTFRDELSNLAPKDSYTRIVDDSSSPDVGEFSVRGDGLVIYINKTSGDGNDLSSLYNLLNSGIIDFSYYNNSRVGKFQVTSISLSGNVYTIRGSFLVELGSIGLGTIYSITFNVFSDSLSDSNIKGLSLKYELLSTTDGSTTNARKFSLDSSIAPNVDQITINKVDQNSVSFEDSLETAKTIIITDLDGNIIIYDVINSNIKSSEVTFDVITSGSINYPDFVASNTYYISVLNGMSRKPFTFRYTTDSTIGDDEFTLDAIYMDISITNNSEDLTAYFESIVTALIIVHNINNPYEFAIYKSGSPSVDSEKGRFLVTSSAVYSTLTFNDSELYQCLILSVGDSTLGAIGNVNDNNGVPGKILISEDGLDYERMPLGEACSMFGASNMMNYKYDYVASVNPPDGVFRVDTSSLSLVTSIRIAYKDISGYTIENYLNATQNKFLMIKNVNTGAFTIYEITLKTDVTASQYVDFTVSKISGSTEVMSSSYTYMIGFIS